MTKEIEKAITDGHIVHKGKLYEVSEVDEDHDLNCEGSMCWCEARRKKGQPRIPS